MRIRNLLFVLGMLLCLAVPALAQLSDDGKTFTFDNGLTLTIPDDWTVKKQDNDEKDFIVLDHGDIGVTLSLYYPGALAKGNMTTGTDVLVDYYKFSFDMDADTSTAADAALAGQTGTRLKTTIKTDSDEYEMVGYAFILPDKYAFIGTIYPQAGVKMSTADEETGLPLLENVLQSVAAPSDSADAATHDFGYRTTLTVPAGWKLDDSSASWARLTDGVAVLEITFYNPHEAGLKGLDAKDVLLDFFKSGDPIKAADIKAAEVGGLESVRYEGRFSPDASTTYNLIAEAVLLPNQAGIVATIFPYSGDQLDSPDAAQAVLEQFVSDQPSALDTIDLGYALAFGVPDGWAVYRLKQQSVELDDNVTSLTLRSYGPDVTGSAPLQSAEDVLAFYMKNNFPDTTVSAAAVKAVKLGSIDAVRFSFEIQGDSNTVPHVVLAAVLADKARALVGDIIPVYGDTLEGEAAATDIVSAVAANPGEMPSQFQFVDGSTLNIPDGWYYYSSTQNYLVKIDNGDTAISLDMYTPDEMGSVSTPAELLAWYSTSFASIKPEAVEMGGVSGVRIDASVTGEDGFDRAVYAFILPNGHGLIAAAYPVFGTTFNEQDALPVLEAFLKENQG